MADYLTIVIRNGERFYRANVSLGWAKKHDNGAIFSCGLTVPADLTAKRLQDMVHSGVAKETSQEEYNHAGCQSSCTLRGDSTCQW